MGRGAKMKAKAELKSQEESQGAKNERLRAAAGDGDLQGVLDALASGASARAKDLGGKSALWWACALGGSRGAWKRRLAIASALIEAGARADEGDCSGWSPLSAAAYAGAPAPVIQALRRAGAKLEGVTSGGQTALSLAAEAGRQEAIEALLRLGADPLAKDGNGLRPAERARERGFETVFLSAVASLEAERIGAACQPGAAKAQGSRL